MCCFEEANRKTTRTNEASKLSIQLSKATLTNMNNSHLEHLYNCSASILELNITLLLRLNFNEIRYFIEGALNKSTMRDYLRQALLDCILVNQKRPFDLPWWQKLFWSLIFAVILLVATGGNIIVIWIVLAHRRMRTVTNYFLVNLSVADLMMSLLNCAFNFIFLLNSNWPFGMVYCTINNFVAHVTVASSVFTLVVISFDRYMAIMHPLKHHMSRKRTVITLILIWGISSALAIPCLLYSTTSLRRYSNGTTRISCYLLWPDGAYLHSKTEYCYNLLFLIVTYLIPMSVMAICYTCMGRKLWGSKSIGELTHYQKESMKSKRKVCYNYAYYRIFNNCYRFRVYFELVICKCCCMIDRTNVQTHEIQELAGFQRSDLIPCNSGRFKSTSVRWRQSVAESQVQTFKMNPRTMCERLQTKEDVAII
ncbi:tachykinin-like peptides receptor 86C [Pogonomyrmex barbatus]|uniref:Tachykinin-like peptides receptor 86C n=1 Tax=Pogonomyrmex barbatus TaxID=144034 RepID=A0A8N1S886_9HYME|nr:tachykinin-like peptides receptor 86C [Pogonomyrmex barbatus]